MNTPVRADEDLPRIFADCAGKYSALLEHAWLMQEPDADRIADRRRAFLMLLEATAPEQDRRSLHRRIEAKAAFASLLSEGAFGTDPDRARWARAHADLQIARCSGMLLDG